MPALLAILFALCAQTAEPPKPAAPQREPPPQHDAIRVIVPIEKSALLESGSRDGRIVISLIAQDAKLEGLEPSDAPFQDAPQPIFSVPVQALRAGTAVAVGPDAAAFPVPLDQLTGTYAVQAVFVRGGQVGELLATGNLLSATQTIELDAERTDAIDLELTQRVEAPAEPSAPNLTYFSMRSPLLSATLGKEVTMRAGVALPRGWNDPGFKRRMWGAVFVVPDNGGHCTGAASFAKALAAEGAQRVMPQAVWIVLEPEGDWGHHGFVDSAVNGARARALVEEFIPELTRQFRLIPRKEARILMGHGAGGWSALWLQLMYPDFFGACFSSAPLPVDFKAFRTSDLYADLNAFTDPEGRERPAYRVTIAKQYERARMTERDETGLAHAISPEGRSGEPVDCWSAMWGTAEPRTRTPQRPWDPATGLINRTVIDNEWSRYDIARIVRANPTRFIPLLRERVRLLAAGKDNYYYDRAARSLKELVGGQASDLGYIEILPDETHFTIGAAAMLRWQAQMRAHLATHGLD